MTQQLTIDHIHPRRGLFATVAELVGITSSPRERQLPAPAPFDPELHLGTPFALLNTGPR